MKIHWVCRGVRREEYSSGFTLLEVLAAIAVVSVASLIIISSFTTSIALGGANRNRNIAAALAEEQLASLRQNPKVYIWPNLSSLEPGQLMEVRPQETPEGAQIPVSPPSSLPSAKTVHDRELLLYKKFSWQAFARLPSEDAGYLELAVVVRWKHQGRDELLALTSSVTRAQVEEAA